MERAEHFGDEVRTYQCGHDPIYSMSLITGCAPAGAPKELRASGAHRPREQLRVAVRSQMGILHQVPPNVVDALPRGSALQIRSRRSFLRRAVVLLLDLLPVLERQPRGADAMLPPDFPTLF